MENTLSGILDTLRENGLLAFLTAIIAALAALQQLVGISGLPLFYADLLLSAILVYLLCHWLLAVYRMLTQPPRAVGIGVTTASSGPFSRLLKVTPGFVALFILVPLLLWTAIPLVGKIQHRKWQLCGTFVMPCATKGCLLFFDQRDRQVDRECHVVHDDTGYFVLEANWWVYRPVAVSGRCDDRTSVKVMLEDPMFSPSCESKVEVP